MIRLIRLSSSLLVIVIVVIVSFYFSVNLNLAWADPSQNEAPYKKQDILNARFGKKIRQELLKKAYQLQDSISRSVVGQDSVAKILQDRLVQYLEGLGSRDKDPIALHLIGLPGIGKSAIVEELRKLDIRIIKVDAQTYSGQQTDDHLHGLLSNLRNALSQQSRSGAPLILLIEELDKAAEITGESGQKNPTSNPLIGLVNQMLTDGKIEYENSNRGFLDVSNVMIITTMNFSPHEIETFSSEVLGGQKNFYDFTINDLNRFDQWIRSIPSARSKVLSRLFRPNTVSRLVPNTVILKPLSEENYRQIIRNNIDQSIEKLQVGKNSSKRITVRYTDQYVDFLLKNVVFPPSGARETVIKVNELSEQLIHFGTKMRGKEDVSLVQPRLITLDYDASSNQLKISVTTRVLHSGKTVDGEHFSFAVDYDLDSRSLSRPQGLVTDPSKIKTGIPVAEKKPKHITKKQILSVRFPTEQKKMKGLAAKIDEELIGQTDYTHLIERELTAFAGRSGPVKKAPPFLVLAGFPGIGKSELVRLSGIHADLPIARVNMQGFTGSDSSTLSAFITALDEAIYQSVGSSPDAKFILLLEELDKVFEINPNTGEYVDRPVMNFIKDLLNDGYIDYQYRTSADRDGILVKIDIRNAYNIITMNFGVDRFGFEADPRLTTIEDVLEGWRAISSRPADLKNLLSSMFLPETVSRLMPHFKIMKPLEEQDYARIIEIQAQKVIHDRLYNEEGQNRGLISLYLTAAYGNYLFQESVIPSEGARNTALVSRQRISLDLEEALKNIPRRSKLATSPLMIILDFDPESSEIVAIAAPNHLLEDAQGKEIEGQIIYQREVELTFPPLEIQGKIPRERLETSIHEFGHAFIGVRLGKRFEYTTVVSPKSGVGGYVRFTLPSHSGDTGNTLLADICAGLGSRAMERIFLSEHPLDHTSVLDIGTGAVGDIQNVTESLWNFIFEYGFDPEGGTIERSGIVNQMKYAHFSDLEPKDVNALGLILRDIEDYLVTDLLKAHSRQWYADRIKKLAMAGEASERDFYRMINYPYPGENEIDLSDTLILKNSFGDSLEDLPEKVKKVMQSRQSRTRTTAAENFKKVREFIIERIHERLHSSSTAEMNSRKNIQALNGQCSDVFNELPFAR